MSGISRTYDLALFSRNLRVPLLEAPRNLGIKETLNDPAERGRFWFYNNGITAICENYAVQSRDSDPEPLSRVIAEKLQIVNGCQTCYMVAQVARDWEREGGSADGLSGISVLIRIIRTGPEAGAPGDFARKIAKYTNSQTPVSGRDLHSTDPEQGNLKESFQRNWNFFLEVKKGEWERRLERDRSLRGLYDKPFPITNEEVAQAFFSFWSLNPVFAKSHKKQLFEDEKIYREIFASGAPPEALLFSALLWYTLDEWRRKEGYRGRRQGERMGPRLTKSEVAKNADLQILAMLGISFRDLWHVARPNEVELNRLRAFCRNVKALYMDYKDPPRSVRAFGKELDGAFEACLRMLFKYSKEKLDLDSELTLRNLWIRPSTWTDFVSALGPDIKRIAVSLPARLTATEVLR